MTKEIANALFGYLETLYNLNQKLVKLCGIDVIDDFESGEKDILDMIQDVPRIIPYSLNKKTKKLEFKEWDGLLEYQDSILYLKEDYAYYKRITRFDFTDFNKIYDNEALRIVGNIMKKF